LDSDPSISYIAGLILLYIASTVFSVIKIIFSSTDKNALPADNERLRYLASKIEEIQENRAKLTATVSFGKTLANTFFAICAYCLTELLFTELSQAWVLTISVAFSVLVLTFFSYVIPRALIICYHQRFLTAAYLSYLLFKNLFSLFTGLMQGLHVLIHTILHFDEKLAFLSAEEKSRLHEDTENGEALDKDEKRMIRQIFELGETTVKEIMQPRVDIKALDITTDYETVLATVSEAGHSRIPVYKENIDSIIGILYAKDILSWLSDHPHGQWDLESLLKEPYFVPTSKMIDDLMREFKKNHIHMAIVVDEYGGTAGIVTLEDILEEIVGEIQDEYDTEEEPVIQIADNTFHVDPHIELDDLAEKLDIVIDHEDEEYNTLSGLFYDEYGDVPTENTEFEYNGLRLKVIAMDNQRIEKIELEVLRDSNNPVDIDEAF